MLNTSLKKYEDITKWPPTWFRAPLEWVNYKTVLIGEKSILPALLTSFYVSTASAIICLLIGILAAYAVARYKFKLRKTVLLIIILTQMFSEVILAKSCPSSIGLPTCPRHSKRAILWRFSLKTHVSAIT